MQAKDIPDADFLNFIATKGATRPANWVHIWHVEERWPDVPPKVLLAKARQLLKRGLIGGCGCGCRGDFHIPLSCCGGTYDIHRDDCPSRPGTG